MKLLDLIKQFGQANYNCGFFNQQSGELTKKYEIERQKYFDEIVGQIDLRVSLQNADGWSVRNKVGEPKETDKIEQTEKQVKVESEVKPEIAEIKKENKKFKEAIKKIYQAAVCGNNNIGKWGLEEYCYNLLNDSSFTA
jgi:hypothetical protein